MLNNNAYVPTGGFPLAGRDTESKRQRTEAQRNALLTALEDAHAELLQIEKLVNEGHDHRHTLLGIVTERTAARDTLIKTVKKG